MTEKRFMIIEDSIKDIVPQKYKEIWARKVENAKKKGTYRKNSDCKPTELQVINNCKLALQYDGFDWGSFRDDEQNKLIKLMQNEYARVIKTEMGK